MVFSTKLIKKIKFPHVPIFIAAYFSDFSLHDWQGYFMNFIFKNFNIKNCSFLQRIDCNMILYFLVSSCWKLLGRYKRMQEFSQTSFFKNMQSFVFWEIEEHGNSFWDIFRIFISFFSFSFDEIFQLFFLKMNNFQFGLIFFKNLFNLYQIVLERKFMMWKNVATIHH